MPTNTTTTPETAESRLVELRKRVQDLEAQLEPLAEKPALSDDEQARWEDLCTERDAITPELDKLEERAARAAQIRTRVHRQLTGLPEARKPADAFFGVDVRSMDWRQARDGALTILDDREANHMLSSHQGDRLDRLSRDPQHTDLARRIIVTENEHYRSAWHKLMTRGNSAVFTDKEQTALLRYEEYRAANEGTPADGGYAVPVFIDPTVILTDQETDNPFLRIARQVTVSTNAWKGVASAGVQWSFDDEAEAVSDDSLDAISQPSVTVHTARGFIPFSIEIGQDWPGFQAEMARLLGDGYDELLLSKFTSGSGNGEPRGLITALDANTNVEVVSSTDGGFFADDLYKVWKNLPQKYRRRASWMMSVDINNRIRGFGTANVYHASTVDLTAGAAEMLFSRPVYENPYFPDYTGTTGAENRLVVGDFANYVIARRTGMNVEFVPHLFDVTNNMPTGQRGWFAHARIGGNSVNDLGFRLLQNQ